MHVPSRTDQSAVSASRWDMSYEWKAVLLLCLGFGLVGIDRFMILPLFPVISKDLNLNYQDLGQITGVLAIAWGVSALFMGQSLGPPGSPQGHHPGDHRVLVAGRLQRLGDRRGELDVHSGVDRFRRRCLYALQHCGHAGRVKALAPGHEYRHPASRAAIVWFGHRANSGHAIAEGRRMALDLRDGIDSGLDHRVPAVSPPAQHSRGGGGGSYLHA